MLIGRPQIRSRERRLEEDGQDCPSYMSIKTCHTYQELGTPKGYPTPAVPYCRPICRMLICWVSERP